MFLIKKKTACFILFLWMGAGICFAQSPAIPLKYLGVESGLSNNVVNSLYLDHFGFMWMGTYDGLNRYDGYHFKVFRNGWEDKHSLVNNHITVLNGDAKNRVWVGTQKGVSYYDYADSKFHQLVYLQKGRKNQVSDAVNAIAVSQNLTVYVATEEKGLFMLKKDCSTAERIPFGKNFDFTVKALYIDEDQVLWLFIKDVGLCRYDHNKNTLRLVTAALRSVTCITKGNNQMLWVGTERGLFQFDKAKGMLSRFNQHLNNENIMSLLFDRKQKLWISTDGGGIAVYDSKDQKTNYLSAGREKGLLSSNSVAQVYEDHESRKWIATLRGGVNIIDAENEQFTTIKHDPLKSNSLINNFVLSFSEDENKNIWIGTDGGGLSVWNNTSYYILALKAFLPSQILLHKSE